MRTVLAATALSAALLTPAPAHAADVFVLDCDLPTRTCLARGTRNGLVRFGQVNWIRIGTCPLQAGTMIGSLTGVITANFELSYSGTVAVMRLSGGVNADGRGVITDGCPSAPSALVVTLAGV